MSSRWPVAVVLGAVVQADGTPGPALRRRVAHAVALFKARRVEHLLFTGGPVAYPVSEARTMHRLALAAGVPAERILLEEQALDTLGNALFVRPLLRSRGWDRVLVVTDGYHLPRALYTFRRLGIAAEGSAAPAGPRLAGMLARLREAPARLIYVVRVARAISARPAGRSDRGTPDRGG